MSEPTIFEGLRAKLGRAPSRFELQQEVRRIMGWPAAKPVPGKPRLWMDHRGFVSWGPKSENEVR